MTTEKLSNFLRDFNTPKTKNTGASAIAELFAKRKSNPQSESNLQKIANFGKHASPLAQLRLKTLLNTNSMPSTAPNTAPTVFRGGTLEQYSRSRSPLARAALVAQQKPVPSESTASTLSPKAADKTTENTLAESPKNASVDKLTIGDRTYNLVLDIGGNDSAPPIEGNI